MNNAKVYVQLFIVLRCHIVVLIHMNESKGAIIKQADWDTTKVRVKVSQDIESHIVDVRNAKLSDLIALYEVINSRLISLFTLAS